jgi:Tn3 transposase DDE domain
LFYTQLFPDASATIARVVKNSDSQRHAVPAELLAHTSPLTWEHIGFSGDFLWDRVAASAGR